LCVSDNNVKYLLELADEYQIERIKQRCEDFLLSQERSMETLVLAQKFHLKHLYSRCVEYAKTRTMEDLESSPEIGNVDQDTLIKIYKAKIDMIRDYASELKQHESTLAQDCDQLLREKDNMKSVLQNVQKLWDTPTKRCYRHMTDASFDFSCRDCNEKVYRDARKLCTEGQHYRRYVYIHKR
jgi:hypothetical protein